jgi:hypothetical protein
MTNNNVAEYAAIKINRLELHVSILTNLQNYTE